MCDILLKDFLAGVVQYGLHSAAGRRTSDVGLLNYAVVTMKQKDNHFILCLSTKNHIRYKKLTTAGGGGGGGGEGGVITHLCSLLFVFELTIAMAIIMECANHGATLYSRACHCVSHKLYFFTRQHR